MEYIITPRGPEFDWSYWDDAFDSKELDILQNIARDSNIRASVGGETDQRLVNEIRRSDIFWMHNTQEYNWVYNRLAYIVADLNCKYYRYDITGFGEPIQMTNYQSFERGTYNWHVDFGGSVSRKLSVVLQLSDPSEYEGGDLLLTVGDVPITIPKKRGMLVVFPSFTLHKVTEVTKGNRQSLVTWISGPPFR